MDGLTALLFDRHRYMTAVYEQMARSGGVVEAPQFANELETHWFAFTSAVVTEWAVRAAMRRADRLNEKGDLFLAELEKVDLNYHYELTVYDDPDDAEAQVMMVGYALAVTRWTHLVSNGRVPEEFTITEEEAADWLARNSFPVHENRAQMSLFAGVL